MTCWQGKIIWHSPSLLLIFLWYSRLLTPKAHPGTIFLAHQCELLPSLGVRRPSVNFFKNLLLWNHRANLIQTWPESSLGVPFKSYVRWPCRPTIMAAMSINRTYGKIAGFWVMTQKSLIKTEICNCEVNPITHFGVISLFS